jgi:putative phosphoribosyl transferase
VRGRSRFPNRVEAGRELADWLVDYCGCEDVVVLALPRGGVPVGSMVARALKAPLDVLLVRKLGVPGHEELAMGAIASGQVVVLNDEVLETLHVTQEEIESVIRAEAQELTRRERMYRGAAEPGDLTDKVVILVDDGLATGASMRAAAQAVRKLRPARVVVAVPVAAPQTRASLEGDVDELVCVFQPDPLIAVGMWYDDFSQVTDQEVCDLLRDQ